MSSGWMSRRGSRISERVGSRHTDEPLDSRAPVHEPPAAIKFRDDLIERAVRQVIADLAQQRRAIVSHFARVLLLGDVDANSGHLDQFAVGVVKTAAAACHPAVGAGAVK
jgi:hypothetical protein